MDNSLKLKKLFLSFSFVLIIFSAFILSENKFQSINVSSNSVLDNKKIEWGIKRNGNNQPDLGKRNNELINEFNGIAMGKNDEKIIYLTFDLGYEAGYTEKILEVLKKNNVKATFFITSHYLETSPDLVKKMIDEGHIVGNHTVNHKSMPSCTEEELKKEIMKLHTDVYDQFNYEMKFLRPPKGEYSEKTLNIIKSLGYTTVMWSFAYDDWDVNKQNKESYAKEKIYSNLHNGEVMLLHGTSKDNSNILDEVIKEIKNKGFIFKNIDEFTR